MSVSPTYQSWWTDEFGPGGTANGGAYADKSYWIATEDWDDYFGNTNQNYPFDTAVYSKSGGFGNGLVPMVVVVGYQNKVYFNSNSTDFRAALRLAIDEFPDPPVLAVSETSFSPTAAPGASVLDTFNMANTGASPLSYYFSVDYDSVVASGSTWHANNFESGLTYTNSGSGLWATYPGGTWNDSTVCANAAAKSTNIMTSAAFNTTGVGDRLCLEFRYAISYQTGTSLKAEYWTGTSWVSVWTKASSAGGLAKVELPVKSASTQVRFTGVMTTVQGTASIIRLDDIKVYSDDVSYRWVQFDQRNIWGEPTATGTIAAGNNQTFNVTFNSTGLAAGTYNANIMLHTNYPPEIDKAIPVVFTVSSSTTPAVPANITTSVVSNNVYINWDNSANATGYKVYSSTNPYAVKPWSTSVNVTSSEYTYTPTATKMFFYIVATNGTKESPDSNIVK